MSLSLSVFQAQSQLFSSLDCHRFVSVKVICVDTNSWLELGAEALYTKKILSNLITRSRDGTGRTGEFARFRFRLLLELLSSIKFARSSSSRDDFDSDGALGLRFAMAIAPSNYRLAWRSELALIYECE